MTHCSFVHTTSDQKSLCATRPPESVVERAGGAIDPRPSREPLSDGQISIKAPLDVLDRFKRICEDDRRTYADMLGILMDRYEGQ